MRRVMVGLLAGILGLTATAQARVMAPPPLPDRVGKADAVVVGKVTAIEAKTVTVSGQEMQVAVVEVTEALIGAKGLTHVRLGFPPRANPRFPQLTPAVGQDACYFLAQAPGGSLYTTPMYFDVIDKKGPNFNNDLALIRRCAKILTDPNVGLKAQDANERLLAASLLLGRYRTPPASSAPPRLEPIDAEQSKLILLALAEADWTKTDPVLRLSPLALFQRLGVTAQDGWAPPKDFKELPTSARKWLAENAGKYRVQRYAAEKK